MSSENESDSISGDGNNKDEEDKVCRDFLRNVCNRGKRCKFHHPKDLEKKVEYVFCHDYQNSKCTRLSCRFLHCSPSEEEYYKVTGELPTHVFEAAVRTGNIQLGRIAEIPVCKDYLKGDCRRGSKCKFRHLSPREYEREINYNHSPPPRNDPGISIARRREGYIYEDILPGVDRYSDLGAPDVKRRLTNADFHINQISSRENFVNPNGFYYPPSAGGPHNIVPHVETRTFMLEDENVMLRKKVEMLKKQVFDLTATNEFLLDQNAQLRMGGKRAASVTAVTVPAVTITNTGAPSMQVQPMAGQIQPAQAPTPQQMVNAAVAAGALRTVAASVATVPVSIAAVAGAPVSIATVSMGGPVQIPAPVVSMAQQTLTVEGPQPSQQPGAPPQQGQQQNPGPPLQQQAGPPLSLSVSGTSGLVSYPLPVLQNSLSR